MLNATELLLRKDSLISGCGCAVESGYGRPLVTVRRSVARRCAVGFRLGDDYDWGCHGGLRLLESSAISCRLAVEAASWAPGYARLLATQVTARCSWLPGWQAA